MACKHTKQLRTKHQLWWGPYDKPSDSGKMNKLKKNVEAGKAASELRSQGDFYAVACPIGYKLKSISNTNPAVVIWTHLSSLECVLSSGY